MAKNGRERIINSSFELFLKQGYEATSLQNIMDATSMSKGAIYHHFTSKRMIYLATLDEYYFKIIKFAFPKDDHLTFEERIKIRCRFFARLFHTIEKIGDGGTDFPIRSFFLYQLKSECDKNIRKQIKKSMTLYRKSVLELVKTAVKKKELLSTCSVDIIALQIMSMVEGIAIHHTTLKKGSEAFLIQKYDEVIGTYIKMLMRK